MTNHDSAFMTHRKTVCENECASEEKCMTNAFCQRAGESYMLMETDDLMEDFFTIRLSNQNST